MKNAEGPTITNDELRNLFDRYGGLCAYCPNVATSIDHVMPLAKGGKHELANLLPACMPCNMEKHDMTLEQWQTKKLQAEKK